MRFQRLFPLILILCVAGAIHAEQPNIAVVDMTRIFAEHPSTAEATRELTKAREASRDSFKEKSNTLKEILQRHQELIRNGKKKEAAEELMKANEAEKAIAALRTTELRDLEEEFRKTKLGILKDIQASIAEFNRNGAFALVLDSSSTSSNGIPQIIHAPGVYDITDDVIAFILKKAAAPEAEGTEQKKAP